MWLDTWNVLTEHGPLVIFAAAMMALDVLRRKYGMPSPFYPILLVAEVTTGLTLVAPKAVRALGEIVEVMVLKVHDIKHAFRHGSRREPPGIERPREDR
jgi:hypothetical protein